MKKTLKRVLKITLIVSAVLVVLVIGHEIWQKQIMDLKNPELESVKSITDFKQQNNVVGDFVLIAKDTTSFKNIINPYFGNGLIWVFDNRGDTVEVNIENLGGSCFEDIKKDIVKRDFGFNNSKLNQSFFNGKDKFFNKLIENTVSINEEDPVDLSSYSFENYDYIVVYGWSKYYGLSHKNSQVKEIDDYIKSKNKNVLLVSVNVDYSDYWYPLDKPLPTIK